MNLKKKILLGVGLLLLVVVIGVPAFLMFRGISQFGSAKDELDMTVNSLRSFYKKNPFPSKQNIKKETETFDKMHQWFGELVDVVTAEQIEEKETTPSSFMTQYNQVRNKIITTANKSTEMVAIDNDFGFKKYAEGNLPVAVDVPRLMQQMMITERLAMIMIDSNVKKIKSVSREEFDSASSSDQAVSSPKRGRRRGSRGRGETSEKASRTLRAIRKTDIYEVQSFTVEFVAKEDVAMDALNRFARDNLFIVVTGVEFIKQAQDLKMPGTETEQVDGRGEMSSITDVKKEKVGSEPLIRQQRRVSGPTVDMPLTVRVDLDVYTFFVHKVKAQKTAG